ncbi:MAG TPA: hypothetical protein DD670_16705 [Planctomycetaceae bacterium]|nr:hypothetical protein [Planctomycetaceae bacterium]
MPRKFKISVCGCFDSCVRPWINDLGLVANRDGTFRAITAGSLGSKPGTGVATYETLTVGQIPALVVALLRLFHAEGDRTRRHRARLRHVRERLGDEVFKDRLDELFREEATLDGHGLPRVWRVERDTPLQAHLHLPLGDLMPEPARELGRAVREARGELRIGLDHDLLLFGEAMPVLARELRDLATRAPVVACPGSTWCSKAIVDSRAAAERIGRRLTRPGCPTIAVSGCPNNCARSGAARVGLVGRIQRVENTPVQGFRVLVGGGEGCDVELARELHPFISADDIDEAVSWLVGEFRRIVDCDTAANLDRVIEREFDRLEEACRRRYGGETLAASDEGAVK